MNAARICIAAMKIRSGRISTTSTGDKAPALITGAELDRSETVNGGNRPRGEDARRRRRSDLLNLLALVGALAGFAIIGKDAATIGSRRADSASVRGSEAAHPADAGSFPAPADLKGWTEALAACARPGPNVKALVASFPGGPAEKMAALYAAVARDWQYEADDSQDRFTPAEILAQPGMKRGDCKQIATLLYASAVDLGITARMIATRGTESAAGHVHTEILLCRPQEDPSGTLEAMSAVWKAAQGRDATSHPAEYPLVWTGGGVYLILDGGPTPSNYQHQLGTVEAIISSGR